MSVCRLRQYMVLRYGPPMGPYLSEAEGFVSQERVCGVGPIWLMSAWYKGTKLGRAFPVLPLAARGVLT